MIDLFEELMKELKNKLSVSIKPQHNNHICTFQVEGSLQIQLQLDRSQKMLFIGSFLTEVPPGKYKENVFTQTLKANSQIPNIGFFAYNEKIAKLFLYEYLPLKDLSSKDLYDYFALFTDKASSWKKAIEAGEAAPLSFLKQTHSIKPSPFNIKP